VDEVAADNKEEADEEDEDKTNEAGGDDEIECIGRASTQEGAPTADAMAAIAIESGLTNLIEN
jgi:hypothetical protein